ncbi:MAG: response regulator transcription factor [Chloroflexi bacterium]|nr:MAG: response regulator transcription factor [Chloroflexota bacterium]
MPDDERSIPPRRPRVCVVDSQLSVPAYDRLDECHLDVMAVLPRISEVEIALLRGFDVVILGCTESMLLNRNFERRATRIAQLTRLVGVAPNPTPDALARAARIGFHGFVAREVSPRAFDRSILAAIAGELAFPRAVIAALLRLIRRSRVNPADADGAIPVTARQRQVIDLIARGANDREIADELRISQSTVHKHVQNALKRTSTKTRSQLAAELISARATPSRGRRLPRRASPSRALG